MYHRTQVNKLAIRGCRRVITDHFDDTGAYENRHKGGHHREFLDNLNLAEAMGVPLAVLNHLCGTCRRSEVIEMPY
jgi:hypothetical protein